MKKNVYQRRLIAAIAMAAVMVPTTLPTISNVPVLENISISQSMTANAASGRLYYQWDSKWKSTSYYSSTYKTSGTLYNSGCGLFAFANAIYGLNGSKMDMNAFANYAKNNGWSPTSGTYRDTLYPKLTSVYGSTYKFKVTNKGFYGDVTSATLINHLKNGGVAVAHVPGHFVAITGYNTSTKQYHVIDSVGSSSRPCGLLADSWVSASTLKSGKSKMDWFCLISKNDTVSAYFPKYTGTSTSIVTGLNAVGADSSYAYRQKIAAANGISGYTGTAAQNTTMLNKLKAGTLKKPGSTPTPVTPVYFKKYTGTSTSIVTGLNAVGADSSYAYRQKIATKNGISGYTGTAAQNTTMLNKLKAGTLIKP